MLFIYFFQNCTLPQDYCISKHLSQCPFSTAVYSVIREITILLLVYILRGNDKVESESFWRCSCRKQNRAYTCFLRYYAEQGLYGSINSGLCFQPLAPVTTQRVPREEQKSLTDLWILSGSKVISVQELVGSFGVLWSMVLQRVGHKSVTEQAKNSPMTL